MKKKLKQSSVAMGVFLTLTAVIALSMSPSTRAQITQTVKSGATNFLFANDSLEPIPVTESSNSNLDSFHFLEPLAPNGGDLQKFDGSLLNYLTVEVCEVSGSGCPVLHLTRPRFGTASYRYRTEERWLLHRELGYRGGRSWRQDLSRARLGSRYAAGRDRSHAR